MNKHSNLVNEIVWLLICAMLIVLPSYLAVNAGSAEFRDLNGMGILIMLLFVGYPLISFGLGMLSKLSGVWFWLNAAIIGMLYYVSFLWFFNSTAWVYIPAYLACYGIGYAVCRRLKIWKKVSL